MKIGYHLLGIKLKQIDQWKIDIFINDRFWIVSCINHAIKSTTLQYSYTPTQHPTAPKNVVKLTYIIIGYMTNRRWICNSWIWWIYNNSANAAICDDGNDDDYYNGSFHEDVLNGLVLLCIFQKFLNLSNNNFSAVILWYFIFYVNVISTILGINRNISEEQLESMILSYMFKME